MKSGNGKRIRVAGVLLSLAGSFLWAANPETDRSSANFDNKETGALQHTKDGANRALNDVDTGVHKAGRKMKRGAHQAKVKANNGLDNVDKGIHKAGREVKDAGNQALDKVDDTVHGR
jgi:ElaB/YqjD/DUF883 family membrane-anchored ribosome-binding protein